MVCPLYAGVIEGFFGTPWGWPARLGAAEFLRECSYQFYIYAPKADAFLRRRWRERMPAATQAALVDLGHHCRKQAVSLGIGLTPFEIYLNYDVAARTALREKISQINEIGPDILCILFDDMRGDIVGLSDMQARIVGDICSCSNATRFIVCPTYYSYDHRLAREFGPPPKTYLRDFGAALDPRIDVFWTGEKVISNAYPAAHLQEVAADLRRKPFIWDNHVSNDSKVRTNHLYLDPAGDDWELSPELAAGIAINPMNQPHLARIALCRFKALLTGLNPATEDWSGVCQSLFSAEFATELREDASMLQNTGLNRFEPGVRGRLLERYASKTSNPYAQEISAWLRNEYRFDPECLTS